MALCEVVDSVRVAINRELETRVGLTLSENLVLCQIAMSPEQRLRMAEIAQMLNIGKSAVTKTVDRLEVTRERDATDRRTVYATLTKDGSRAFVAAQPIFDGAVNRHFTQQLDASGLGGLQRMTARILSGQIDSPHE